MARAVGFHAKGAGEGSSTYMPRRAGTQWPTTGAPEAFAWQDWRDGDGARSGRRALSPTKGIPAAQFARSSGLWRIGKEPSIKLGREEPRTTVRR